MVNLHHPSSASGGGGGGGGGGRCGVINARVLQQTVAAKWAVDVINNRSLDRELRIGEKQKVVLFTWYIRQKLVVNQGLAGDLILSRVAKVILLKAELPRWACLKQGWQRGQMYNHFGLETFTGTSCIWKVK